MWIGKYKTTVHTTGYVDIKYVPNGKPSKYYPKKCYIKLHAIYPNSEDEPWFIFEEWLSLNKKVDTDGKIFSKLLPPHTKQIISNVRLINEQALYLIEIRYNLKFMNWLTSTLMTRNREEVTNKLSHLIS